MTCSGYIPEKLITILNIQDSSWPGFLRYYSAPDGTRWVPRIRSAGWTVS